MSTGSRKHGDATDVETRLTRLERSNKAWRLAALGLVGAWAITTSCSRSDSSGPRAAAADQPAENGEVVRKLRVNEIELVNLKGETVGWIDKGGEPSLSLSSSDETMGPGTVELSSRHGFPLFQIQGPGTRRITLTAAAVDFENDEDSSRLSAGDLRLTTYQSVAGHRYKDLLSHGCPPGKAFGEWQKELSAADQEAAGVNIFADKHGGIIRIRNTFGKSAVDIEAIERGGGEMTVWNSLGKAVVEVQANKTNEGAVYVNDVNGKIGDALSPRMPR